MLKATSATKLLGCLLTKVVNLLPMILSSAGVPGVEGSLVKLNVRTEFEMLVITVTVTVLTDSCLPVKQARGSVVSIIKSINFVVKIKGNISVKNLCYDVAPPGRHCTVVKGTVSGCVECSKTCYKVKVKGIKSKNV